jgi:hypothetical protein
MSVASGGTHITSGVMAWNTCMAASFLAGASDRPPALDDPDEHDRNRQDQKQVEESSQGVRADHPQQPHDHEDHENGPQHGLLLVAGVCNPRAARISRNWAK